MGSGFVPRFVGEIAFLALLALAAGLAELETPWIIAVMTVCWALVALVEWLAWRSEREGAEAVIAPVGESAPEETTGGWDLDDILAPLPEPEHGTEVIPPEPRVRGAGGGT